MRWKDPVKKKKKKAHDDRRGSLIILFFFFFSTANSPFPVGVNDVILSPPTV